MVSHELLFFKFSRHNKEHKRLILIGDSQSCCTKRGVVEDTCGRRCHCVSGTATNCSRVRKEFTSMSFIERRRFINTFKKAGTHPLYRTEFGRILDMHRSVDSRK